MAKTTASQGASSASDVCSACGMCCDGTLFSHVRLGADEVEPARRLRLAVYADERGDAFRQPCSGHVGSACAVYSERPRACVAYQCVTLKRHLAGELTRDEALSSIRRLRSLADALRARLEHGAGQSLRHAIAGRLLALGEADTPEWRRENGELLMALGVFRLFVERAFVPKRAPTDESMPAASG